MLDKIKDGRTDLVFDFIQMGNGVNSTDDTGISLIQWCAYYGDVSAIKFLITNGSSLDNLGSNYDLNGAAFHGHWRLCQFLLEQGADANYALPDSGESALHAVLCKANRPVSNLIIKLLLAYGADPNHVTKPRRETGGFMRDVFTRQETPLHRAAAFADVEAIELLLNAGADKTKKDMNGDSPLTWASWYLRTDKILSLLCYGNFSIHPHRLARAASGSGEGWSHAMDNYLLGKLHV
jgi:ankyrin repeat protein